MFLYIFKSSIFYDRQRVKAQKDNQSNFAVRAIFLLSSENLSPSKSFTQSENTVVIFSFK